MSHAYRRWTTSAKETTESYAHRRSSQSPVNVEEIMLSGSEKYYDDIYSSMGKDYAVEANKLHELIQKHKCTDGNTLLDVACGTGRHAGLLSKNYEVMGTGLNADMLKVARKKHPEIHFIQSDMMDF